MTHILIQTDCEIILIRDEQTCQRMRDDSRYGGIWNYVPINQLQDLIIEDDSDRMVNLTIRLSAGDFLHMPCAIERRPELEQFVQNIKEAIKYPVQSIS